MQNYFDHHRNLQEAFERMVGLRASSTPARLQVVSKSAQQSSCSPYLDRLFVCDDPERFVGESHGNGQCVRLVQIACGAPHTSMWTAGPKVSELDCIPKGTAIATFYKGKYQNAATGNHAAIYLSHNGEGIQVIDQWSGRPAGKRTIAWRKGRGSPSNDGDAFSIIVSVKSTNDTA